MAGYWIRDNLALRDGVFGWPVMHCVLTLKMIGIKDSLLPSKIHQINRLNISNWILYILGLTFDLYDGQRGKKKGKEVLSKDQLENALYERPSLLELLSHGFFLGSYFFGPLTGFRKYKSFATPSFHHIINLTGSPNQYAMKRLGLGVLYIVIHLTGSAYLPMKWLLTAQDTHFMAKLLIYPLWGYVHSCKMVCVWLIAEGVCVVSGMEIYEL